MLKKILRKIPGARRAAVFFRLRPGPSSLRRFVLEVIPPGAVCAEIGVYRGEFSAEILKFADPKELHLIDPWRHEAGEKYRKAWYGGRAEDGQAGMDALYRRVREKFARSIESVRVVVHRKPSGDALPDFPDGYFDWIYVDGNHLYPYVRKDLELAFLKTRRGGHIAGDDYMEGGWWEGGVKQAVDEFDRTYPVKLIALRNRQFLFRKE